MRRLTKAEAAAGMPVELRGVVTMAFPGDRGGFVLDDGEAGIFVNRVRETESLETIGELEVGNLIEVSGVTTDGRFARDVMATSIRRLGNGQLPDAKPVRMDELLDGHWDCQSVMITGVVQSLESRPSAPTARLMLAVPGERKLPILVMDISEHDARMMLDAKVSVSGVATSFFNERGELIGVNVQVPDVNSIRALEPPHKGDGIPLQSLDSLRIYSPDPSSLERVKVHGTVSFAWQRSFYYIQDGDRSVRVTTRDGSVLSPGDRVEILGYPEMRNYFCEITGAEVTKIGEGKVPGAVGAGRSRILRRWQPAESIGGLDGRRVEIEARLDEIEVAPDGVRRLFLSHEGSMLLALLAPGDESSALPRAGSRVRTTGICVVELNTSWPGVDWTVPEDFHLLLQSPADVVVISNPPWWTPERIWSALAVVAVVAGASAVWVILLRRQVHAQTETIRLQSSRETLAEERSRLAREFHDTLEQELTGISIQLDAAADSLPMQPDQALQALESAHTLLSYTRTEARRSIWDLRAMALQERGLFGALQWSAQQLRRPHAPEIVLSQTGESLALGARVETHLLRIGSEGLANAVKHSKASRIHLALAYDSGRVEIRVEDDGVGFDVPRTVGTIDGHFGLRGMRERANQIGATFDVKSVPGHGTAIIVTVETNAANPT